MNNYKKRIVDEVLQRKLKGKGAVLIEGPKWCGKTTTAEQISKSVLYMDMPANKEQNLMLADINPSLLLKGNTPRLIDEWQLAPKLWDAVRFEVDHRKDEGQFILTGSSVPADMTQIAHTGTGRFSFLLMRPMTLFESLESTGDVSLKDLFNNKEINGINKLSFEDIAYVCCRGGWPRSIDMEKDIALDQAIDYYDAVVKTDISRVDGVKRNSTRVRYLMRSYARNIGSQASNETLKNDVINNGFSLDTDTIHSYISALKKIFVIEEVPAWNPNLRSKVAIRSANTRYYIDPSIATAALGIGPNDLINDLNTFGFVFENLCTWCYDLIVGKCRVTNQPVVACTERPVVNINGIFVLCLPITALGALQGGRMRAFRHEPILEIVASLFQVFCINVLFRFVVVGH